MEWNFPSEADSRLANQDILVLLWNSRTLKSPPLDPVLSLLNPIHTLTPWLFKIYFDIVLRDAWSSEVVSSLQVVRLKFCMHFSFSQCAAGPIHLILHLISEYVLKTADTLLSYVPNLVKFGQFV